ncbi:MAG: 4-hydroxybenzoate octaprenyltransferase [Xanthomonadales bacterium]|jgi:4-hydroxybenzoate polyprenyltransferase|nr:4-hydroxybenzoate octaprenyltransferase [Xanthomonadales bacterium]
MSDLGPAIGNARFDAYWRLMRFDRPIGILLLLWPTLWALWLAAGGLPSIGNLLIFVIGVVVMRAAGCVANDLADRDFDPHVERTRSRPLASGALSPRQARVLLAGLLLLAFTLVLLTNALTIRLSFVGAALALSYPFFKRFVDVPQVVLGIAFGWSIPMAFAAETGAIAPVAWALLAINVLYAVIYDTFYAMVDREDDRLIGVRSTALLFGRQDLRIIGLLQASMLVLCLVLGWQQGWHWPWYTAVAVVAALFVHQLVSTRSREREACFRAFLNNNWVGMALFAGIVGETLLS